MLGLPPWEQRSIFHEARFQLLLQRLFVSGDVIEQANHSCANFVHSRQPFRVYQLPVGPQRPLQT
jgi:hypothetical protein